MSQTAPQAFVPLPGSERKPFAEVFPGGRDTGPAPKNEDVDVSIYLKPVVTQPPSAQPGQHMTREAYAAQSRAHEEDLQQVVQFAQQHGLGIVEVDPVGRIVKLHGTVEAMQQAFKVELHRAEHGDEEFRVRQGPVHLPAHLIPLVAGVVGLDDRPQAKRRRHIMAEAATAAYTPPQVASLYHFPTQGNGQGQAVAIIELGGGYRKSDLTTYFGQLGLSVPKVTAVKVDGGKNAPTTPQGADGEVALDIQIVGAVAPGAHIVVYFAPNTDQGFLDAITKAVHDTANSPSIISISWGGPESSWTAQSMQLMDQAFQTAGTLGVTVCCAAGDNGANDGVTTDSLAHVDFPASSPNVLACGGTHLESANNTITGESVWNNGSNGATGGGISDVFALPTWQANAHVPASINPGSHVGRGVPDVAGDADPQTGYQVLVDGQQLTVGGTSAVAPLWAGLLALINQQLGKPVGFINPTLYQQINQAQVFNDIVAGNNNGYSAGPGWDACTGWGSADGTKLLNALEPHV
jgi:kumamolisin